MKKKFINDISANSAHVIINQCCGLVIFYILSSFLDKNMFGEINWTLAVLLTSYNILSFGIDQVVIKRIASGNNAPQTFSLYATHTIIAGSIFYVALLAASFIFNGFFTHHQVLLLLGFGKLMLFLSFPFKQVATGLEKFRALAFMSVCSSITKSMALLLFALLHRLNITSTIIIFVAGDLAELVLCYFISRYKLKIPLQLRWNKTGYGQLIKESLPQVGVVIFTSALARFDWILLGLLASNIIVAEYSFAYKVFEMATLPLLVIAPVLITRFTKIFYSKKMDHEAAKVNDLLVLLRIEMLIASITAMVLCICWVPLMDKITNGKYGYVNRYTIFILAGAIPLLYLNNFLWTINFTKGALRMIFRVMVFSFLSNILGDTILIPYLNGEGAAIGYLVAMAVQTVLFSRKTSLHNISPNWYVCLKIPAAAFLCGLAANALFQQWWSVLFTSLTLFFTVVLIAQRSRNHHCLAFRRVAGI